MCHEQNWLVYHPVLSVTENNGWYFFKFFSVVDKLGWYINRFCLSSTKIVGISTVFVGRGQYWLVYFTVMSWLDNIGW